jgi:hypothetical protein
MSAIVTLLLITGGMISAIAWSKAVATSVRHSYCVMMSLRFLGSVVTYYGKFFMFNLLNWSSGVGCGVATGIGTGTGLGVGVGGG